MEKLNKETIKKIPNSPGIYYIKNIANGKILKNELLFITQIAGNT